MQTNQRRLLRANEHLPRRTLSNANHGVPEHVQFQLQRLNEAVVGDVIFAVIQTIANTAY